MTKLPEQYYRPLADGRAKELRQFTLALPPIEELHADMLAADFGPRVLKAVRQKMIDMGWYGTIVPEQSVSGRVTGTGGLACGASGRRPTVRPMARREGAHVSSIPIPGAAEPAQQAQSNPLYRSAMAVPYLLTAGLFALLVYAHAYGEPFRVSAEDGFVEWATVASFAICGLLATTAAVAGWPRFSRAQRVFLILFGILVLAAVGEELSWGQRWFGFRPPESMKSGGGSMVQMGHNDTTLHNLSFELGPLKFSLGGMLFGVPLLAGLFVHGVWLPWRVRQGRPRSTALVRRLGLFLPPAHLGILLLASATLLHYRRLWNNADAREFKELVVPMVYAFAMMHAYFRDRKGANTIVTGIAIALLLAGFAASLLVSLPG